MRIDLHSHLFPRAYLERLEHAHRGETTAGAELGRRIARECRRRVQANPGMTDMDARLREMDSLAVDLEVLSVGNLDVYFAGDESHTLARNVNDALASVCEAHPDRFQAFASVPLNDPDSACIELERAVVELGMRGVVIGTNVNGRGLDSAEFQPFFATVADLGVVVALHPTVPAAATCVLDYGLAPMVGFVFDTGVAVLRLILGRTIDDNPGLRILVPHLGGMLHYLFVRIDDAYSTNADAGSGIERAPSDYLRALYYDSVNFFAPAFRCAIDVVGSKQIVLGSDYPFFKGRENLERALAVMDEIDLSVAERRDICSGNALRLLERAPTAPNAA